MGQSQSHSASLGEVDEEIERVRSELFQLQQEGREQRKRFDDELFEVESELYAIRMKLLKRGEESKSIWNFWDYAKEVQQTFHARPSQPSKKSPAVTTPPSQSTALVAPWYFFNIHSLFEAMLLRRLHIAMMLQGQRDVQSSAWNSVIVHIFQMIPGIRDSKKKTQEEFEKTKTEIYKNIAHSKESYQKQLQLQKELVQFMKIEAQKDKDKDDSKKRVSDRLRESMTSIGSASTQPLPNVVSHQVVSKSPGGTSAPTDDSSDASSLTSSSSSDDDSSESDEESLTPSAPTTTEPPANPPLTERV